MNSSIYVSIGAAWGVYLSIAGAIYFIGKQMKDTLRPEVASAFGQQVAKLNLSNLVRVTFAYAMSGLDKSLGFKRRGRFFVPSFKRTLLTTAVATFVVCFAPAVLNGVLVLEAWVGEAIIFANVLVIGSFADYVGFIKTRTILHYSLSRSSIAGLGLLIADLFLSFILALVSTALAILIIALWQPWVDDLVNQYYQTKPNSYGTYTFNDWILMSSTGMFLLVAVAFFFTSLSIFFVGLICQLISLCAVVARMTDAAKGQIVKILDFKKNPAQSASVVVIFLFTLFYVPIAGVFIFL